jgi:hypothetical protein
VTDVRDLRADEARSIGDLLSRAGFGPTVADSSLRAPLSATKNCIESSKARRPADEELNP